MNQSKIKLAVTLIVLATAFGLGAWALSSNQAVNGTRTEAQAVEAAPAGRTEITYLAQPGATSLKQLQDEAQDVVIKESEYGKLVDSIEGHKGGTDGKYWSFYINGEMAQVGADAYIQKEGDLIEWKFQKL